MKSLFSQPLLVIITIIYFFSWVIALVEQILFQRFIKNNYPILCAEYFPSFFKRSTFTTFKRMGWILKKRYLAEGDADLTSRANLHRKTMGLFMLLMFTIMGSFVAFVIVSIHLHQK